MPSCRILAYATRLAQEGDAIDAEAIQTETQDAVEMLQTLQSQLEDVSTSTQNYISTVDTPR